MPSKIETSLTPEQLHEFFHRAAQLKGTKLRDLQALAEEFGVEISLMSAKAFREGDAWQDYLDELRHKRELAEDVTAIAEGGLGLSQAAASKFAAKVFDAVDGLEVEEIGTERGNNLSLAIARLTKGDRDAKKLQADLTLRDEQVAKLTREREEWEAKRAAVAAQLSRAKSAPAASADEVRTAVVAEIDKIMGLAR